MRRPTLDDHLDRLHRRHGRTALEAAFASEEHDVVTVEDVAELTPPQWEEILESASIRLSMSKRNAVLRALRDIDDLPRYNYSTELGRQETA